MFHASKSFSPPRRGNAVAPTTDDRIDPNCTIRACYSMPCEDDYDFMDLKRTSSGGYNFFKKRSMEKQHEVSRSKAQELSVLFELSDLKALDLNKPSTRFNPSDAIGKHIVGVDVQGAAAAFRDRTPSTAARNPLLTESQRSKQIEKERKQEELACIVSGRSYDEAEIRQQQLKKEKTQESLARLVSGKQCSSNVSETSETAWDDVSVNSILAESDGYKFHRQGFQQSKTKVLDFSSKATLRITTDVKHPGKEVGPITTRSEFSVAETTAETPSPVSSHKVASLAHSLPLRNFC